LGVSYNSRKKGGGHPEVNFWDYLRINVKWIYGRFTRFIWVSSRESALWAIFPDGVWDL
jgi:hypothetical protein